LKLKMTKRISLLARPFCSEIKLLLKRYPREGSGIQYCLF